MKMKHPLHPGFVLKELCIDPLNLTLTEVAKALKISRKTLSEIVNGKTSISTMVALKISIAFNTTPESWLESQMEYDLWKARQKLGKNTGIVKLAA